MAISQLKRLKASLKENGIIGQQPSKKQRRNNDNNAFARRKREEALESIRQAFNPFDTKVNRQKQDVINRNVQGSQGKPSLTRQMEVDNLRASKETRKARQNRVGGLVDRRFGENNPSLSYEDKMLERFTREHQTKASKKSMFNLEDDDDDNDDDDARFKGKYGKSLSLADDFDEGDLGVDQDFEEEGRAAYEARKARNFDDIEGSDEPDGGEAPVVEPERKKSKNEVMKEVIAKSKSYKHERQQARQEDLEIMDDLDDETNIKELMSELQTVKSSDDGAKAVINEADDAYEQIVREMTFDKRAQPSDRTLTEEEKAKADKERLDRLQKERLARMSGEYEGDGVEDINVDSKELDSDNENENDAAQFGFPSIDPEFEMSEEELSEGEASEAGMMKKSAHENESKAAAAHTSSSVSLPCPQSLEDFMIVLSTHPLSEQPSIVTKLINAYDPSKANGNKKLLSKMAVAMVDYVCWLAEAKCRDIAASETNTKSFDKLVSQLKSLSESYPEAVAEFFRERLEEYSLEEVPDDVADIFFFMLIGVIFSTSDHYHHVSTTAELLIAGWSLRHVPISELELSVSLLLIKCFLAYQRISKRYAPEIIYFLYQSLAMLLGPDVTKTKVESTRGQFHTVDIKEHRIGGLAVEDSNLEAVTRDNTLKLSMLDSFHEEHRPALLSLTLTTLETASDLWRDLSAYSEIFSPFASLIEPVSNRSPLLKHIHDKLSKQVGFANKEKKPLRLQDHRPIPLQTRTPKFEENYSLDKKSYDIDRDMQEQQKLRAEFKKEKKAAMRDIRRESKFEAQEKLRERISTDNAYHKKLAHIERSIATEEGTEKNRYERAKKRR